MKINYPKHYQTDAIFSRYALDPLFEIDGSTISFLLYHKKYHRIEVNFKKTHCFVKSSLVESVLRKEVMRIFDLDTDFTRVEQELKKTPLYESLKQYVGIPLCLDTGLYESLIRGIIHQQVSMKGAYTLTRRLIDAYGVTVDGLKGLPRADVLEKLAVEDLRALKINTSKAEYLIGVAKLLKDLDLEELSTKSIEEVSQTLLPIRGIGRWTVHTFLLFGVGNRHLFMADDLGVLNAIKEIEGLSERPTKKEVEALENQLGDYQSYVTFYLWQSLGG